MKKYEITSSCVFCGTCVHECPFGAITLTPQGPVIDENTCKRCGECYDNCMAEAIIELEA